MCGLWYLQRNVSDITNKQPVDLSQVQQGNWRALDKEPCQVEGHDSQKMRALLPSFQDFAKHMSKRPFFVMHCSPDHMKQLQASSASPSY